MHLNGTKFEVKKLKNKLSTVMIWCIGNLLHNKIQNTSYKFELLEAKQPPKKRWFQKHIDGQQDHNTIFLNIRLFYEVCHTGCLKWYKEKNRGGWLPLCPFGGKIHLWKIMLSSKPNTNTFMSHLGILGKWGAATRPIIVITQTHKKIKCHTNHSALWLFYDCLTQDNI